MIVKPHKTIDGKHLFAICDDELLGKKFVEGNKQLDLTGQFYKGEKSSEVVLKKQLVGTFTLNIIGKKSVVFFEKLGFVNKENTIVIAGIPHAEVVVEA